MRAQTDSLRVQAQERQIAASRLRRSALDKASTVDSSSSGGGHVSVALGAVPSKGNLRASSTDSAASHAGPSAVDMAATPGSRLLDLVQDQERQLLEQVRGRGEGAGCTTRTWRVGSRAARSRRLPAWLFSLSFLSLVQAGEAPGGSAALRLDHAHEQLMSVAAARRPAAALQVRAQSSVGSGRSTDPSQAVRALAAQLQGDAQEADKVSLEPWVLQGTGVPLAPFAALTKRTPATRDALSQVTLERVLGRGGGGTVYLGEFCLPDGVRSAARSRMGGVSTRRPGGLLFSCARLPSGKWRGLPVAVKTMVFEAWEDDDSSGGAAASNKARLPYMRAIMETAISANLGHLHVVSLRRTTVVLLRVGTGLCKLRSLAALLLLPQVATYHHDIKRMADDHLTAAAQSGLLQASLVVPLGQQR